MSILDKNIRLAELKFVISVVGWDDTNSRLLKRVRMSVGEIKKEIRRIFDFDEQVEVENPRNFYSSSELNSLNSISIHNEHRERDAGISINIDRPEGMDEKLFLTILKGAGLLDLRKIKALRGVQKKAELKFEVEDTHSGQSIFLPLNQVIQQMKDLYAHMYKREDGIVDIHIFYDHVNERMKYTFSTDHINHKFFIYAPKNMSQEVFLTILKGSGIYAHNNVYDEKRIVKKRLKKSSIQKLGELEFRVSVDSFVQRYTSPNDRKLKETENHILSFKELKDKLDSISKEKKIDKRFRYNDLSFHVSFTQGHAKCVFHEDDDVQELEYRTIVKVLRPENLSSKIFKNLIEGAVKNVNIK